MQQFYQDANSGPLVYIEFVASADIPSFESKIKPNFTPADGWTVAVIKQHKEVSELEFTRTHTLCAVEM